MYKNLLSSKFAKISLLTFSLGCSNLIRAQQVGLTFDGSDDYIQTNFPGVLGSNSRTVEAWIKTTATSGENLIVSWGSDSVNGGRFTIRLNTTSGISKLRVENKGGGVNGNITVNDGNWHHIAVVYDNSAPSATRYKLYVDGVQDVAGSISTSLNTLQSTNMIIGRRISPSLGGFFNGTIDEVRVWNAARSQTEIQANMNTEICSSQTNLVSYFKFNDGVASASNTTLTSVADSSVNSFSGTFNNFALSGNTSNFNAGASALGSFSINPTTTLTGSVLTANQNGAAYQWIDCNNSNSPINGATNQTFTPTVAGNYSVIVTLSGCSVTSVCQSVSNLSVKETNPHPDLSLSPNPSQGLVRVKSNETIDYVEVISPTGQNLMNFKVNARSTELDISSLKAGLYLVKVTSKNESKLYKIIKK
ncbi:putative secreted protein (Por secretion system target) [Chryseobacterium sp. 52]|uniref:LamG-like jellyroll fold domain-containing protein n=1 Tax=Chryseobacterium sp. 52 TaxID=2035213 RepID=UPI000C1A89B0|nr:LamG-like jellyroll fold domain-containing protein [Chryseobacterium sp. 52]PIF44794.1 putative secreted protein (Por secretion system target) [Chryseobacterium sp. 52]